MQWRPRWIVGKDCHSEATPKNLSGPAASLGSDMYPGPVLSVEADPSTPLRMTDKREKMRGREVGSTRGNKKYR